MNDFRDLPKLPENYHYSWKSPFGEKKQRTPEEEERIQKSFFESMKRQIGDQIPENQRKDFQRLGEKFHQSFDAIPPAPSNEKDGKRKEKKNDIFLEESLAYVSENVKAGLHPKYLNVEDIDLLRAGYGEEWYEHFGYSKTDLD